MFESKGESRGRWLKLRNTYLSIICLKAANIRTTDEILADKLKGLTTNDDESIISDPFGEYHDVGYLSNGLKIKVNISKRERDMNVVSRFTEEYKKILKEIGEEQQIPKEIHDETLEDVIKILNSARETLKAQSTKKLLLKDEDNPKIDNDIIYEIVRSNPEDSPEQQSVSTCQYMSGIWNMIVEECKDKPITITPLNFNFYEGKNLPQWLKNDYVTDVKVQQSQKKCFEWLCKQDNTSEDSSY